MGGGGAFVQLVLSVHIFAIIKLCDWNGIYLNRKRQCSLQCISSSSLKIDFHACSVPRDAFQQPSPSISIQHQSKFIYTHRTGNTVLICLTKLFQQTLEELDGDDIGRALQDRVRYVGETLMNMWTLTLRHLRPGHCRRLAGGSLSLYLRRIICNLHNTSFCANGFVWTCCLTSSEGNKSNVVKATNQGEM